jgi:predicted nucleotidyltransferase
MARIDAAAIDRSRRALRVLARRASVAAAYIFGSHCEGRADYWSDIDLAVFVRGAEDWDMVTRARIAAQVQKEAGDEVELHFFPAQVLKHAEPGSFAAFVIKSGIAVG